ncbi:hypothetical protein [Mesorhizobium sp.]|uniref:hypothetical protein n=1 Tax=Mesorhizobium sp. TaxID=1871066 RepID=UPI000FE5CB03|nr:hypothetical protein [Mesorhizobium sp.]RWB73986.1 MAG: hypothetical protein EOQ50_16000 [Mesorhizobium sp.]RWE78562.1 MAG: hypothetical protein EOS42_04805 [Mesorhizobium sp.]TIV32702.1 MAG: hypothetical protein E5V90_01940 [Mesorhizobium sp.]
MALLLAGIGERQLFQNAYSKKSWNAESRMLRGEPIANGDVLGQDFCVIQQQRRDVALARYRVEVDLPMQFVSSSG